ncbi:MAG: GWxTD domain-containing protein [Candidatus Aminicenantes bacterium]|nr:GWxTD domain-containing protein [Candidatus Aminicenantes bacterium]
MTLFLVLIFFSLFFGYGETEQVKKRSPKDLPPKYRQWLEEEVVYIISPKEREVFLQLETDRERDLFIEGFWRQRDLEPSTPENEFKKEHYRRLDYANKNFGRETPGPGWRTDMGRIYIILGEPKTIERFENLSECYPVVVWFYEGMSKYGLPNSFYIVFFKEGGAGEYKLYSPIRYGPQYLLVHYYGDMADYERAYRELYQVNPLLAEVSLNLIPGEAQVLTPSIASEVLLASRIPSVPHEMVKPIWAEKLLAYKDIIEVDYSTNYIDCEGQINVIQDSSGIHFVHYLIEPKRLTIEQIQNRYFTNLEVNGIITDDKKRVIYQFSNSVPIEISSERLASLRTKLFSFQDIFPLIPGSYQFNVILKNTVSKEFTSYEAEIRIPEIKLPTLSEVILANRIDRESKYKNQVKPFLINQIQLVPSPRNDFTRSDTLYIFFQILNVEEKEKNNFTLEYTISNEKEVVFSLNKRVKDYANLISILEELSLKDFPPDYYQLTVKLMNKEGETIASRQCRFYISPSSFLARPWILSFPYPPADDAIHLNVLGNQFFNKREIFLARYYLEKAYQKQPNIAKYALDYAQVLFNLKEYPQIKEIASPFLKGKERTSFLALMGRTCQALEQYDEASQYYQEYLSHFGTNLLILNSLGECFYRLGQREEALKVWQKSLEIDPNQENIKKLVDSLKNKR